MHFLGLAAMPRRISNYPFTYSDYNFWASFGSSISVVSVVIFFAGFIDAYINSDSNKEFNKELSNPDNEGFYSVEI